MNNKRHRSLSKVLVKAGQLTASGYRFLKNFRKIKRLKELYTILEARADIDGQFI
jgi:hypothetical protein